MSTPPPAENRGSLGLGIGLAWACLIAGYTVSSVLVGALYRVAAYPAGDALIILGVLLPWLLMIALIIWLVRRGQPRTAAGVGVGIASILGVALLLVAACFGLLSSGNFH